jgi:hypothetical protein
MPFKSKSQQRYLFAKEPEVAKKFAAETKSYARLPEAVKPRGTTEQHRGPDRNKRK